MNGTIKKILIHICSIALLIIASAFTGIIIFGKSGDSEAGDAIRTELANQEAENRKLAEQISDLTKQSRRDSATIRFLREDQRRLTEANKRLRELSEDQGELLDGAREDSDELARIQSEDEDTIRKLRELLQEEDS